MLFSAWDYINNHLACIFILFYGQFLTLWPIYLTQVDSRNIFGIWDEALAGDEPHGRDYARQTAEPDQALLPALDTLALRMF
jgi:hypothetical protein